MSSRRPEDLDATRLRHAVQLFCTRLTFDPDGPFPIHRGLAYAVQWLGYDPRALASLPTHATGSFTGVGNPHVIAPIRAGETIVDLGCGSGTDLLIAAQAVGPGGRAIGLDMTDEMREQAARGAAVLGLSQVEVRAGDLADPPLASASVDVAITNGALALVPDVRLAIAHLARMVRAGGRLQLAEVIVNETHEAPEWSNLDLWTCGLAGALSLSDLLAAFDEVGFAELRVTARFDCFRGSACEAAARRQGAIAVNLFGVRR